MWDVLVRSVKASLLDINFLYFLMGVISVAGLGLATTVLVRGGRIEGDGAFARHVRRMQSALPAVVVLSITTIVAGIQGGLERTVHDALGWDFTSVIYAFEGDAAARFQAAVRAPILDAVLVAVYTAGAFLLYFIPFFTLVALGRGRSALRVALTIAGIWAVGVVAYFLLPVNEVWLAARAPFYDGAAVTPILFEHFPEYETSQTYLNSVNNNIPSLHTALSCGIALSLWLARERWLAIPATIVATGVTIATVYLGIHWFVDVAAGLATMAAAAWFAHKRVPLEEREIKVMQLLRRVARDAEPVEPEPPAAQGR